MDNATYFLLGAIVGGLIAGAALVLGLIVGYGLGLHHATSEPFTEREGE